MNILAISGILSSIISFFLYQIITNEGYVFGYYYGIEETLKVGPFYMFIVFGVGSLTLFINTLFFFKRYVFPSIKDKIRDMPGKFIYNTELVRSLDGWR